MGFSDKFNQHVDLETFDAEKAAESLTPTGGLPLPPGEYGMVIEECEDQKSKKGGEFRRIVFKVVTNGHDGRKVYQNFPFDCGNENVERKAIEQIMAIWIACGGSKDAPPSASEMMGKKFIGLTSLEFNDYKDGSYSPIIVGVELDRKKTPRGEHSPDAHPQIWFEAVDFYKAGGGKKKGSPKVKQFADDDDIPF